MNNSKRMFAQKWRPTGKEFEKNCAETIDISDRRKIDGATFRLFRCDVTRRSERRQRSSEVARRVEPFRESKITDEWFGVSIELISRRRE